jgi:TM2 domain-containing membrane protein YozV
MYAEILSNDGTTVTFNANDQIYKAPNSIYPGLIPGKYADISFSPDHEVIVKSVATGKKISKMAYVLVAIFLGGLGVHKFLVGKVLMGVVYLVLCWSFIPAIIGVIEGIMAATKPADSEGNIIV